MRIAGYIDDPILKITIFQYEGKYSVQFETPHYAQIFKIRHTDDIRSVEDVRKLIGPEFIESVKGRFQEMHAQTLIALQKNAGDSGTDEFDVII